METGLPAVDPVRFDPAPLADAIIAALERKRGGSLLAALFWSLGSVLLAIT